MPTHPSLSRSEVIAHIDGASRGNPGPAAYAVVLKAAKGSPLAAFARLLGTTTNNFAEYQALLAALEYSLKHHHLRLRVLSDSELLVRQIRGIYKVKSADLKPLHEHARRMIAQLEAFAIEHVPRAENRDADRLANQALDAAEVGPDLAPALPPSAPAVLQATATYRRGLLRLHQELPLAEGEEVALQIRRKK